MEFKYLLTALRMIRIPGILSIMRDWHTSVRMYFIYSALESGLLETLQSPCTRELLLERLDVKRPEVLDAILDVGLSVKELSCKNGFYFIKGKRSKSVIGKKGDAIAAVVQALTTYYNLSYRNAAKLMQGSPYLNNINEFAPVIARISKLTEPLIKDFIKDIVSGKESMRILEIGCGSGILLKSAFESNPKATGIGIDVDEEVTKQAANNLNDWGIGSRFKIIKGDIINSPVEIDGPFDLITLYNVLYYFPFEKRSELFKKIVSMLSANGEVAIVNSMQSGGKDWSTASLNLTNTVCEGITPLPDLDETLAQLGDSGLNRIRTIKFMPGGAFYGIVARA